jgi:hypothetical protein
LVIITITDGNYHLTSLCGLAGFDCDIFVKKEHTTTEQHIPSPLDVTAAGFARFGGSLFDYDGAVDEEVCVSVWLCYASICSHTSCCTYLLIYFQHILEELRADPWFSLGLHRHLASPNFQCVYIKRGEFLPAEAACLKKLGPYFFHSELAHFLAYYEPSRVFDTGEAIFEVTEL